MNPARITVARTESDTKHRAWRRAFWKDGSKRLRTLRRGFRELYAFLTDAAARRALVPGAEGGFAMRLTLITSGTVALTTLTLAATLAVPAYGAPTAAGCKQAKLNASAKTTAASLGCYAKAAATGLPVDPNCVGKADHVLATAFAKTDAKGGCATTGDAPAVEASINACVNEIAGALGSVVRPNRCLNGKLRAAGKKASAKLKCAATAAAKSVAPDAKCLAKAETAFASTWSSLEARGGCPTVGDANAIETLVDDDCMLAVEGALGLSTSSTPTFQCCSVNPATGAPLACLGALPGW